MAHLNSSKVGGWLLAVGGLGITIVTGAYATTSPAASIPLPSGVPLAEALAASLAAAPTLTWAGNIGIIADVVAIAGCMLLALREGEPVPQRLLWTLLALSTAMFIVVDALAAQVIPTVASMTSTDLTAYAMARKAFDFTCAVGVFTFSVGYLAAFRATGWPPLLRHTALGLGLLGIVTFALHLFGITVPMLFGASVGIAGVLGTMIGVREARATPAA